MKKYSVELHSIRLDRQQIIQQMIEECEIEVTSDNNKAKALLIQIFLKFPELLLEMPDIQRVVSHCEFIETLKKATETIAAWPKWKRDFIKNC